VILSNKRSKSFLTATKSKRRLKVQEVTHQRPLKFLKKLSTTKRPKWWLWHQVNDSCRWASSTKISATKPRLLMFKPTNNQFRLKHYSPLLYRLTPPRLIRSNSLSPTSKWTNSLAHPLLTILQTKKRQMNGRSRQTFFRRQLPTRSFKSSQVTLRSQIRIRNNFRPRRRWGSISRRSKWSLRLKSAKTGRLRASASSSHRARLLMGLTSWSRRPISIGITRPRCASGSRRLDRALTALVANLSTMRHYRAQIIRLQHD
jgi:hypothetical protein